jgi:hypothetical protein
MSIRDELEWRKSEGRLIVFKARIEWARQIRVILMCPEVEEPLNRERTERKEVERWARLEADMSWFVEGGYVNRGLIKQLSKVEEIWNIRSTRPSPSLRVFGRFAEPDVFVATHVVERKRLGAKGSSEYRAELLRCQTMWNRLFTFPPFTGKQYNDYVQENAEEHPTI